MAKLVWDVVGSRRYESGIDRGVLYVGDQAGVAWNGLTSVTESATGASPKPVYVDGDKYSNTVSREEFQGTLTAYTYPDEFSVCDGVSPVRTGVFATKQKRKPFGLSYRTMIGTDLSDSFAYKLHLIYNILASPSNKAYKSLNGAVEIEDFSWALTSTPPSFDGFRRTAHVILDSRTMNVGFLASIEDMLYGNSTDPARLPSLFEIVDLVDTNNSLVVTDLGDGTYTMVAPMGKLKLTSSDTFDLTWSTVTLIDADTFTVASS